VNCSSVRALWPWRDRPIVPRNFRTDTRGCIPQYTRVVLWLAPSTTIARVVPTNPSKACGGQDEVTALDIPLAGEFDALAFDFRLQGGLSFVTRRAPELFVLICILNTAHPPDRLVIKFVTCQILLRN